ncbi:lipid IV(A) 4-amino-4-deoxy-L-arabinosyltransferase [Paraferrimonas haliotis]|uniref:Undecaprenyl phosphate-alpha-4-amino-4-deoxy-L-arabinose arabinosyl transferase n=1 Tax=Paraferrimonas haliotis TaxID=2013866 RepID=A0AA37WVD1_9GAMM|nr:lipid IV(A) 4-amino-4-deoxy-L-arabinosyltransferase [Paraferrimonas haliotis]GLS82308.1 undecaprenyl phosphate-alpha-4-amino-4-deoxy-L-arabinose arabinosyl transferase [Paraferrimonas haliotis]
MQMLMKRFGWVLALAFILLYLLPLGQRPLWEPDETRYGEISREMVASGNWIAPQFLELRYFEKPIMGYWMNSISLLIFGDNAFAVRFMSAMAAAGSAVLLFWLTLRTLQCRRTALMASGIYLSSFIVFMIGTYSTLDSMLSFWVTAAFVCFYWLLDADSARQRLLRYALFGVFCAAAFMTKGFVALALPVVALFPFMAIQGRLLELIKYGGVAVLSAAVVSLPWAIAIHIQQPDYWNYFFWEEHIRRFAADNAQHKEPFWFYIPWLLLGALPWTGAVVAAIKGKPWQQHKGFCWYLLLWALMPFLLFSYAKGKLPTYILPCFAPLSVLLAMGLKRYIDMGGKALRWAGWLNMTFAGLLLLALLLAMVGLLGKEPLYGLSEIPKMVLGVLVFGSWAVLGFSLARQPESKPLTKLGLMPVMFMLLVPFLGPQSVFDRKAPGHFIEAVKPYLNDDTSIISQEVGLAGSLAWHLNKGDITLWGKTGEVKYGLKQLDSQHRLIGHDDIAATIAERRQSADVAVFMRRKQMPELDELPAPDEMRVQGRYIFYLYRKVNG